MMKWHQKNQENVTVEVTYQDGIDKRNKVND